MPSGQPLGQTFERRSPQAGGKGGGAAKARRQCIQRARCPSEQLLGAAARERAQDSHQRATCRNNSSRMQRAVAAEAS
eukprot:9467680-Pyramimonas_sp.AAC.1